MYLSEEDSIPELVAKVYEGAPLAERARLLEQVLRPLGLLSAAAVAGGIFGKARLRGDARKLCVQVDEIRQVCAQDVAALVRHAEQISVEIVDGLTEALMASPIAGATEAGILRHSMLERRIHRRTLARRGWAVPEASPC